MQPIDRGNSRRLDRRCELHRKARVAVRHVHAAAGAHESCG
jgi:hypothetical protein